eukprot:scaffold77908_cov40-Prasinocladus_malaysianus.AAC.1
MPASWHGQAARRSLRHTGTTIHEASLPSLTTAALRLPARRAGTQIARPLRGASEGHESDSLSIP